MVERLPFTLQVRGPIDWANRKKKEKQVHVSPPESPLSREGHHKAASGWFMLLLCYTVLAMMTGEADRCTLIRVGRLINSTQASQNRNLSHTHTAYTTTQQVGRLHCGPPWLHCRPIQPNLPQKENRWPWVGGYRTHKGTAGLPYTQ